MALAAVQAAVFEIAHFRGVATGEHLAHQPMVIRGLIARMGLLKHLPVIGKDLLKDTPVPCGCGKHPSPPSEEVGIVAVPWLYHGASALSTLPQGAQGILLHCYGNCLQINQKK